MKRLLFILLIGVSSCSIIPDEMCAGIIIGKRDESHKSDFIGRFEIEGKDNSGKSVHGYRRIFSKKDYDSYNVGDIYPRGSCYIAP